MTREPTWDDPTDGTVPDWPVATLPADHGPAMPTDPYTDADALLADHLARRPNLDRVAPWLFTGGDLHPEETQAHQDLAGIRSAGVTHILDLRVEWSDEAFVAEHAPELVYVHLGVDDAGQRLPDEWFETGIDLAHQVRTTPGAALLAHCHMGINRGPSMAFALLLDDGWDPVEALTTIRTARPIAGVAYAADALDHHHRRTGANAHARRADLGRVTTWFRDNHLDTSRIIRGIRAAEGTTFN